MILLPHLFALAMHPNTTTAVRPVANGADQPLSLERRRDRDDDEEDEDDEDEDEDEDEAEDEDEE